MKAVYQIVVIEQVTQRVWYEVTGVQSEEEAIAAYQAGKATETDRKHLSTDRSEVEDVYQEEGSNALPMEKPLCNPVEIVDHDREEVDEEDLCHPDKSQAPDLETLMEWEAEGGCEATDGCWVEPDGLCEHGCKSWLLVLGLI